MTTISWIADGNDLIVRVGDLVYIYEMEISNGNCENRMIDIGGIIGDMIVNSFVDANFNHKAAFVGTPFMATIEYKYYKDEIESLFE